MTGLSSSLYFLERESVVKEMKSFVKIRETSMKLQTDEVFIKHPMSLSGLVGMDDVDEELWSWTLVETTCSLPWT